MTFYYGISLFKFINCLDNYNYNSVVLLLGVYRWWRRPRVNRCLLGVVDMLAPSYITKAPDYWGLSTTPPKLQSIKLQPTLLQLTILMLPSTILLLGTKPSLQLITPQSGRILHRSAQVHSFLPQISPARHRSTTPARHRSTTPARHRSTTPARHRSTTRLRMLFQVTTPVKRSNTTSKRPSTSFSALAFTTEAPEYYTTNYEAKSHYTALSYTTSAEAAKYYYTAAVPCTMLDRNTSPIF